MKKKLNLLQGLLNFFFVSIFNGSYKWSYEAIGTILLGLIKNSNEIGILMDFISTSLVHQVNKKKHFDKDDNIIKILKSNLNKVAVGRKLVWKREGIINKPIITKIWISTWWSHIFGRTPCRFATKNPLFSST